MVKNYTAGSGKNTAPRQRSCKRLILLATRSLVSCTVFIFILNVQLMNQIDNDPRQEMMNTFVVPPDANPVKKASQNRVMDVLRASGAELTDEMIKNLPTWDEVVKLYGGKPRIIGLETCPSFQKKVHPSEAYIGPAGMFNTGTNLLSKLLSKHCAFPQENKKKLSLGITSGSGSGNGRSGEGMKLTGMLFQVPWGKHNPIAWRNNFVAGDSAPGDGGAGVIQDNVLPVIMIKDPYHWMGSVCRHPYQLHWRRSRNHCPNLVMREREFQREQIERKMHSRRRRRNLRKPKRDHAHQFAPQDNNNGHHHHHHYPVPELRSKQHGGPPLSNDEDRRRLNDQEQAKAAQRTFEVWAEYGKNKERYKYDSLADLWSTWYGDYLHQNFPRLMVRYEDLLLYPSEIITSVCHCSGGTVINADDGIKQNKDSAKPFHRDPVGLVDAITRYGKADHRTDTMTKEDLEYAKNAFSSDLMDLFHYSHPETLNYK